MKGKSKFIKNLEEAVSAANRGHVVYVGQTQYRWKSLYKLKELELPADAEFAVILRRPHGSFYVVTLVS